MKIENKVALITVRAQGLGESIDRELFQLKNKVVNLKK